MHIYPGISLVLYFRTFEQLRRRATDGLTWKFLFTYSTALFALVTIDTATNEVWGEIMWIEKRASPGVSTFLVQSLREWYQVLGSTTVLGMVLMGDALMVRELQSFAECSVDDCYISFIGFISSGAATSGWSSYQALSTAPY